MGAPTASVIVAAIGAGFGALASYLSTRNSRRLSEIAEKLEIARHAERLEGREEVRRQLLAAVPDVVVPVPVAAFVAVPEELRK